MNPTRFIDILPSNGRAHEVALGEGDQPDPNKLSKSIFNEIALRNSKERVEISVADEIDQNTVKIKTKIESHLGRSIKSLLPVLPQWMEEYGEGYLLDKAEYISSKRASLKNIIGAFRTAVVENYDTSFVETAATNEHPKSDDDRYATFYSLFPDV